MNDTEIIRWLLNGDVSIQYQTYRDLLNIEKPELRRLIEVTGWGALLLSLQQPDGHWGKGFYQPKWTSTNYTLLDLKNLNISPDNPKIKECIALVLKHNKGEDGGINPSKGYNKSDVCLSGMVLNYASYFGAAEDGLKSIVDFLLKEHMSDGGFNCHSNWKGAVHSSMHSTLSVLEGILEYGLNGYKYRTAELLKAAHNSHEFLLEHKFFRSDKTGKIINPDFLRFHYPSRWHYNILRALDYFRKSGLKYDARMSESLSIISKKRSKEGYWKQTAGYSGHIHFQMESNAGPGRWNTLIALRVLQFYKNKEL